MILIADVEIEVDILPVAEVPPVQALELNSVVVENAEAAQYKYFAFAPNTLREYEVRVNTAKGDVDVVADVIAFPSIEGFQGRWFSQQQDENSIRFTPNELPFTIHIGVCAAQAASEFSISVIESDAHALGKIEDEASGVACKNCARKLPQRSIALHEAQCARVNYRCVQCSKVMPVKQREKHARVAHALVVCECGIETEQFLMEQHKSECCMQPTKCIYCEFLVPLVMRGRHQELCGNSTSTCVFCDQVLKRKELAHHISRVHQV